MKFFLIFTGLCFLLSIIADRKKTWLGVIKGIRMFVNILPSIVMVIILVNIMLSLIPNYFIVQHLGKQPGLFGYLVAGGIGSVALIPGFIAYPLAGALLQGGVGYPVLAIFITTLMMVGILTLPIEIRYFGRRVAFVRNLLFFIAAIVVGIIMGMIL